MAYRFVLPIATSLLLGLLATPANAHTPVVGTLPKHGSILDRSPPSVEVSFRDPVRLTSMVAIEADGRQRKLEFNPTDSAATFKVTDPKLGPGRVEIRWKALSRDGHVISGAFLFSIKPAKTN